ncbi:MAG: glycosyl transferase group 1 [Ilumatobacteraceae bacterium]|nr:glycosyl transferase group 1 [Ilumatobacteraceae bacterium]
MEQEGARTGRRPRVLFLGHGAERTGPPILLGHLLAGLADRTSWDLSVLVARSGPLLADYRRSAGRTLAVSEDREPLELLSAGLRRAGQAGLAARVGDAQRQRVARKLDRPDLVYVNAATPPTAALLRALVLDATVPVIVHVHELDVGLRGTLVDEDRALLLGRADHLIAASGPVAELLVEGHGVEPDRVTTCEEFIDVSAIRPLPRPEARAQLGVPHDVPVVGSVGLPDWRKDPEHLLRAVASLPASGDAAPWVVWIGGDPASVDGGHLEDEARRLGLAHRFRHVPHADRPAALLHALDVFALPAREDAMPLAALEAAAAGLPIVCFRTGGIAGLCDRGAGTAVPYPDTAAFAGAIAALLADDERRAETGFAARALVTESNDIGPGVARIAAVIEDTLLS